MRQFLKYTLLFIALIIFTTYVNIRTNIIMAPILADIQATITPRPTATNIGDTSPIRPPVKYTYYLPVIIIAE